jgi:hypothetical protein
MISSEEARFLVSRVDSNLREYNRRRKMHTLDSHIVSIWLSYIHVLISNMIRLRNAGFYIDTRVEELSEWRSRFIDFLDGHLTDGE